MTKVISLLFAGLAVLFLSAGAHANGASWTMPYSGSCSNATSCIDITATTTGTPMGIYAFAWNNVAIEGDSASTSGVVGWYTGTTSAYSGVSGNATNGPGVEGRSTNGIGVSGYGSLGVYGSGGASPGVYGISQTQGVEGVSSGYLQSGVYGIADHSSGGYGVYGTAHSAGGFGVYGYNSNASGWAVYASGKLFANSGYKPGGGSWTDSSDIRLKKNVKPLEGVLDRLMKLQGVTFEWIEPEKHGDLRGRQTGMIAQDVEKVFPEWVGTDGDGFKTLTFRGFEALSVEGMRLLKKENETLRSELSGLEDRIKKLEARAPVTIAGFSGSSVGVIGALALAVRALVASRRRTS